MIAFIPRKKESSRTLVGATFLEPSFSDLSPLNLEADDYKEAYYYNSALAKVRIEESVAGTVGTYACFLRRTASAPIDTIAAYFELANTMTSTKNIYSCWREVEFLWNYFGPTNRAMQLAREVLEGNPSNSPDVRSIWQVYMTCLLEHGKKDEAALWLERYIDAFGLSDLESVFPVCALADELGCKKEAIHEAAVVFRELEKSEETLRGCFGGKSIAVVGSGPQEIGKGRRDEIESHDVVLRFNDCFPIRNPADYGEKTTIWCRNMLSDEHFEVVPHLEAVLVEPDTWHVRHRSKFRKSIYQYVVRYGMPIANLMHDPALKHELNAFPTSGALVADLLQRLVGNESVDYYGFSFLEEEPLKTKMHVHYYEGSGDGLPPYNEPSMHHNARNEQIYLRKMLGFPPA